MIITMMKKIILTGAFMLSQITLAQVGINTADPKAELDIVSSDKGILIPRVANPQTAVTAPDEAELVYDTTNKCFKYYTSGAWSACLGTTSSSTGSGGTIDIGVGQTAFYIKKVPSTPGQYMSNYFSDVPVVDGLRLDAYIAEGLNGAACSNTVACSRYDPRLVNTTSSPIKVHYTAIASVDNNITSVNKTIAAGAAESVDGGGWVYAGSTYTETETIDLVIGDKWYRILYFAYIDSTDVKATNALTLRTIRISITRLQ
jgi:hypothetical protein